MQTEKCTNYFFLQVFLIYLYLKELHDFDDIILIFLTFGLLGDLTDSRQKVKISIVHENSVFEDISPNKTVH